MTDQQSLASIVERARSWAASDPDPRTRSELEALIEAKDESGLHDRFDHPLVFGTAGLRGALGAGPARMNRLVVRQTTAGLARFVADQGAPARYAGIVVGRDARHGSEAFARDTAEVAAGAGIRVHQFSRPLPTPITAFAVRRLHATAGVMITASHNPPADNGYKAYVADGAQIIPPDDELVAELAGELGAPPVEVLSSRELERIVSIDEKGLLDEYADAAIAVLDPNGERAIAFVYTPLHGVGAAVVPELFSRAGFSPPIPVARQAEPDPDFPTVAFPNPEEPGALDLALEEAKRSRADLVLANDPDADRLAVAVTDRTGRGFRALSGNELGALLGDYLVEKSSGPGRLVATTIVSSRILRAIAKDAGIAYEETLTGFKWIARAAKRRPGHYLLFGFEEALGYAVSDAVADKDGMSAALVAAELAAKEKARGRSLLDRLDDLYVRFGVHASSQLSLRSEGQEGIAEFAAIMRRLRSEPPTELGGHRLGEVTDYLDGSDGIPPSDALAFELDGSIRVVVRPSGTEPKLKAYIEVRTDPPRRDELDAARRRASEVLEEVRRALESKLTL